MQQTPAEAITIDSDAPETTERLGEGIGSVAAAGLVIGLRGPLGAGKTCLVRGIGRGLGITSAVRSPTFTICSLYQGSLPLFHVDAYRLEDGDELWRHGFDEMLTSGVVVVEWADRVEEVMPGLHLDIELSHRGVRERRLRVQRRGNWPAGGLGEAVWEVLRGAGGIDS